jgi:hypothetical protein
MDEAAHDRMAGWPDSRRGWRATGEIKRMEWTKKDQKDENETAPQLKQLRNRNSSGLPTDLQI